MRSSILTQKRAKSLRRTMTAPERTLWTMLKGDQLRLHFRRQHAVGPYILDFFCAEAMLCVEVDGPVHAERVEYDQRRTEWLSAQGIRAVRFSAADVEGRPAWVVARIVEAAAHSTG